VLLADLHRARALAHAVRVERAAAHRGLAGRDHALDARHHTDARDDAAADAELRPPGRERRDLEKRRVGIEQQLDALAGHELAALPMPFDVLRTASRARERKLLVEVGELLEECGPVALVGLGLRVHVAAQDLHGPGVAFTQLTWPRASGRDRGRWSY